MESMRPDNGSDDKFNETWFTLFPTLEDLAAGERTMNILKLSFLALSLVSLVAMILWDKKLISHTQFCHSLDLIVSLL